MSPDEYRARLIAVSNAGCRAGLAAVYLLLALGWSWWTAMLLPSLALIGVSAYVVRRTW